MEDSRPSPVSGAAVQDFFASDPTVLPLYRALEVQLLALGNVTAKHQKTQISFYARKGFAWVWLPPHKVKGRPAHYFVLSLSLNRQLSSPRIAEAFEPYPGRWMHHLILSAPEDLDEELLAWLREAYTFGMR